MLLIVSWLLITLLFAINKITDKIPSSIKEQIQLFSVNTRINK